MAARSWFGMSSEGWRHTRHAAWYVVAFLVLLQLGLGWYWSREPEVFWVAENANG